MSEVYDTNWVTQRYDRALAISLNRLKQPLTVPVPQPTTQWPPENIALLVRYCAWLLEENSTSNCIEHIYLPLAGHVLGLNLKPHAQLNLTSNLEKVLVFTAAKQLSPSYLETCRLAVQRFARFLRYEREVLAVNLPSVQVALDRYHKGLPQWLIEQLTRYQHVQQANWRPSRLKDAIRRFWNSHSRLWCWLFAQEDISELRDIKRHHLFAYMDERLAAGYAVKSINLELRAFQATLRFL